MHIWRLITQMGVKSHMPNSLQDRIRFANNMGIVLALAGASLIGVYTYLGRSNLQALILMSLFGFSVPFFNRLGVHILMRMLISIAPAITVISYDILLKSTKPENLEIISYITPRYVVLASMMLPLVLFTHREKWLRNTLVFLILLAVFNFDYIFRVAGVHFTTIRSDLTSKLYPIQWINLAIVAIIILSTTSFLLYTNKRNDDNNQKILAATQSTNEKLKESELKLKEALAAMQQSKIELERQSYVATGLAHFLQLLRQEKDFDRLCQILLSNIATYIGMQKGVIYWINDTQTDEPFLQMRASFALEASKIQNITILAEEGLVGTCFKYQKDIHIKNIPDDYDAIFSGLGAGKPKELILLPFIFDQKPCGVIELATLSTIEPYQIDLLKQVVEASANTLHTLELSKQSDKMLSELQKFKSKINYL